jgi:undecaprenyl-diphosphatase
VEHLVEHVLSVPAWAALLVVFGLPFLEASIFLGLIFPGEIAVFLGGVIASHKIHGAPQIPLVVVLLVATGGAILGDQVGYFVGKLWGEQLLLKLPRRLLPVEHIAKSRRAIRRLGAKAVIVGRWTAALRAFVPGLAGMAGMPYVRFAFANVVGGALWATLVVLLGYTAGTNWPSVYHTLSRYSLYALIAVVVLLVVWFVVHRRRKRARARAEAAAEAIVVVGIVDIG